MSPYELGLEVEQFLTEMKERNLLTSGPRVLPSEIIHLRDFIIKHQTQRELETLKYAAEIADTMSMATSLNVAAGLRFILEIKKKKQDHASTSLQERSNVFMYTNRT